MKKTLVVIIGLSVLLSACEEKKRDKGFQLQIPGQVAYALEREIQSAVRQSLKDPDSAKFEQLTVVRADQWACQGVNARNGFGGYTGTQQALLVKMQGSWNVVDILEISHQACRDMAMQMPPPG